jgi:hypothetical protein
VSDTVGAGSVDFGQDGRTESGGWVKGAKGLRKGGQKSIFEAMGGVKKSDSDFRPAKRAKLEETARPNSVVNPWTPFRREDGQIRETSWPSHHNSSPSNMLSPLGAADPASPTQEAKPEAPEDEATEREAMPQIFSNVNIYINGSTAPAISDHKLKHLISNHGGRLSIALGRRTVTHVIIGRPNSRGGGGCGGGLAGSKIQKEVTRMGGRSVKFVTAEWVVESVKAGKSLPESRFEGLRLAPKGVGSVASMFGRPPATPKNASEEAADVG